MTDSEKLDLLLEKVSDIDGRLMGIEKDTKDMKLTLENEIRINIQRIAEGHLDLSRNLQQAYKPSNEVEMLAIKVRMLETDMREMKQKILQ